MSDDPYDFVVIVCPDHTQVRDPLPRSVSGNCAGCNKKLWVSSSAQQRIAVSVEPIFVLCLNCSMQNWVDVEEAGGSNDVAMLEGNEQDREALQERLRPQGGWSL